MAAKKINIRPLGDRVLVEQKQEAEQIKGGIVIPDTAKEKPQEAVVIALGTGKIDDEKIAQIIDEHFDLRPGAIIRDLKLRRPIYRKTAAYGHFGREDADFTWENTDKAAELKAAAGL